MSCADRPLDPELLLAHADGLRALARRLLRDAHRAEDVVQDAMLVAVRRPPPDDVPLGPWLVGVVRNLARMARRGDSRRVARERLPSPRREEAPADAAIARAETHRLLVDAVLALGEPYRATIVMRYLDGHPPSEIARRTGDPCATVRTRIHRGLALLRERLDAASRRDGRSWVAAFVLLTRRPQLASSSLVVAAACLVVGAAGFLTIRASFSESGSAGSSAIVDAASGEPPDDVPVSSARQTHARADGTGPRSRPARDVAAAAAHEGDAVDAPVGAAPPASETVLSVEIVDDAGGLLHDGVLRLEPADTAQVERFGGDAYAKLSTRLGAISFGAVNPVVLSDVPAELDGLELAASATVRGLAPTERVVLTVRAGQLESARLVASRPRDAFVRVVDRSNDTPVAGATVVSETELRRRGVAPTVARGRAEPGAAVTTVDGTCWLGGLGRGDHSIVVEAAGYLRAGFTWSDGELRARLEPKRGEGTVAVTVFGPDGRPAPGIGVSLHDSGRSPKSDPDGRVVFAEVPAGFVAVSLEMKDWIAACKAAGRADLRAVSNVYDVVRACGTVELALGLVPASSGVDARIVGDDGAPRAGVAVKLLGMSIMTAVDATSDAVGRVRIDALNSGRYMVRLGDEEGGRWWAGRLEVADATRVAPTWTFGEHVIRGRVVSGPERTPVSGANVHAHVPRSLGGDVEDDDLGPGGASVSTGPDGRFEIRNARRAKYEISASHGEDGARRTGVVVPSESETVLELVGPGRVAVRYVRADRPRLLTAKIDLLTADGEAAGNFVDGDGDVDLVSDGLVPGRYEVHVSVDGRTRKLTVEVQTGQTAILDITAP